MAGQIGDPAASSPAAATDSLPLVDTPQAIALPADTPDWDTVTWEVACSRCGYNLRLLTRPQCPECGLEFQWHEALDAGKHGTNFLFEHQYDRRPIRSFLATAWGSLFPGSFWKRVSIHDRVRVGPLAAYGLLILLLGPVLLHAVPLAIGFAIEHLVNHVLDFWGSTWLLPLEPAAAPFQSFGMWPLRQPKEWVPTVGLAFLTLPLFSLLLVLMLRETLARCRLRTVQAIRAMTYALSPAILASVLLTITGMSALLIYETVGAGGLFSPTTFTLWMTLQWMQLVALIFIPAIYIRAALKNYLQIPRASIVAATVSGVAFLATATILVTLAVWGR